MKSFCMRINLCFFTLFISMSAVPPTAVAQQFQWVTGGGTTADLSSFGSSDWEQVKFMCTDPNGNAYVLSTVGYTIVTADTFSGTTSGAENNLLITSYNCNGHMRWAKLISSSTNVCDAFGITADSLGNIYVAGNYPTGTLHIGNDTAISGAASEYLTVGLIQLDTSGHFRWIRYVGPNTLAAAESVGALYDPVTIDGANNAHYFCYMKSGVTLMTGVTSVFGTYDLTYNPAGMLLSATRLNLDSDWNLQGVVIDPATNKLYGYGQGGASGGSDTFFAAAFDASRNLLWQYYNQNGITGISIDKNKHLYFSGAGNTLFTFNGVTVYNSSLSSQMGVIMTTDTNGTVGWIKHYDGIPGTDVNYFTSVTTLPNNKIAAVGTFTGYTRSEEGYMLSSLPGYGYSPYLIIVDSIGYTQTMQQMYGDGFYNEGLASAADKVGNLYIGGFVSDSIFAGSPPISAYYSVGGNTDFFVMKYGVACSCTSMPVAAYTSIGTSTVGFTYTGTTTGLDSLHWNFGDGGTSALTNPTHTYTAVGTFQACVTVYTDCGDDSICNDFVIPCVTAPTASYSTTGTSNMTFSYTGTTTGVDSIEWNYGDGTIDTGLTTLHTYTAIGTYTVCVTAYSTCGSNTFCNTVVVICLAPSTASFSDTGSQTIGFTYTGATVGIDSVVWNFGDGSATDTGMTVIYTYTAAGTYTVCVTVYNSCGSDSFCSTIVIPPLGINTLSLANVQVFPNPTNDELYITGILQNTSYRLLDVTGECIQHGVLAQGSNTLSIKNYAPGIYILEVTDGMGNKTVNKVVKE